MPTTITNARTTRKVAGLLNELLAVELDVVDAYEAAAERVLDPASRAQLRESLEDHRRHAHELSEHVRVLGATPATTPDAHRLLSHGRGMLARVSGDKAILQAMRSNENEMNTKYERAASSVGLDPRTRGLIRRYLADERRHRAWVVRTIEWL